MGANSSWGRTWAAKPHVSPGPGTNRSRVKAGTSRGARRRNKLREPSLAASGAAKPHVELGPNPSRTETGCKIPRGSVQTFLRPAVSGGADPVANPPPSKTKTDSTRHANPPVGRDRCNPRSGQEQPPSPSSRTRGLPPRPPHQGHPTHSVAAAPRRRRAEGSGPGGSAPGRRGGSGQPWRGATGRTRRGRWRRRGDAVRSAPGRSVPGPRRGALGGPARGLAGQGGPLQHPPTTQRIPSKTPTGGCPPGVSHEAGGCPPRVGDGGDATCSVQLVPKHKVTGEPGISFHWGPWDAVTRAGVQGVRSPHAHCVSSAPCSAQCGV